MNADIDAGEGMTFAMKGTTLKDEFGKEVPIGQAGPLPGVTAETVVGSTLPTGVSAMVGGQPSNRSDVAGELIAAFVMLTSSMISNRKTELEDMARIGTVAGEIEKHCGDLSDRLAIDFQNLQQALDTKPKSAAAMADRFKSKSGAGA